MLQALIIGLAAVSLYGLFLFIRGMVRLYKDGQKKLLLCAVIFFVIAPLLVVAAGRVPQSRMSVWIAIPAVLLALIWALTGYFLEGYLRNEKKRRLEGRKRMIPPRPAHWPRNDILTLAGGVAIWLAGVFIKLNNPTIDTCALCISVFLIIRGASHLWRYRGF